MSAANKPTGGQAFPLFGVTRVAQPGMTLRDYFAAQAMQAMLVGNKWNSHELAKHAYHAADAMLAAREAS